MDILLTALLLVPAEKAIFGSSPLRRIISFATVLILFVIYKL